MTLRQLFRPRYGEHFIVTPKRRWSPKDRRSAQLAAKVADHMAPQVFEDTKNAIVRHAVYGAPFPPS
jgi:hypothetical protein